MDKIINDINECYHELEEILDGYLIQYKDDVNESMIERKPISDLKTELNACCSYFITVLNDIVKRYRLAGVDGKNTSRSSATPDYIKYNVKGLCIYLFKPYFKINGWVDTLSKAYEKSASDYKFENGIIDDEPPDDLYNSLIVYFKDFVINLSA